MDENNDVNLYKLVISMCENTNLSNVPTHIR